MYFNIIDALKRVFFSNLNIKQNAIILGENFTLI